MRLKKQLEDLRKPVNNIVKTPMQISIETMDQLIQRVRNYEEQFQKNLKQQNSDYENSLVDCRVRSKTTVLYASSVSFLAHHS